MFYSILLFHIISFQNQNPFLPLLQRMDLGECPKLHDLALRADYEAAAMQKDYFYDVDVSSNTITSILINLHYL